MLLLSATISYENVPFNISVRMRPSIDFGNGFSYSGIITPTDKIEMFTMNEWYTVDISMVTVDEMVFDSICDLVKKGCSFIMKVADKEVGKGKVIDFLYIQ